MANAALNRKEKNVVITGASTGIGEACTEYLASRGWRVFAGVRREEDGRALASRCGGNSVVPIILDVTNPRHIEGVVNQVREQVGAGGLQGLVNNAGIAVSGPLEHLSAEEVERQFRVNVFGPVALTQAFMPLLRTASGRIVFTSSNSGFWCEPFLSIYGGSKHALEAIGDSLRVELRPWKIHVALVEPGMIKTPIWDKARRDIAQAEEALSPEARAQYAKPLAALRNMVEHPPAVAAAPIRVAYAVTHALEARCPRTRYRVGLDSRIQYYLRRLLPDQIRDRITMMIMGL